MAEEQPTFKVVDRRPFNPDGTPRELSAEEKEAQEAAKAKAAAEPPPKASPAPEPATPTPPPPESKTPSVASESHAAHDPAGPAGSDPLDDPASFISLIMSLASNAAASLGMMPHPVTGETGVDLKTAKHWIDVLGMLEEENCRQPGSSGRPNARRPARGPADAIRFIFRGADAAACEVQRQRYHGWKVGSEHSRVEKTI